MATQALAANGERFRLGITVELLFRVQIPKKNTFQKLNGIQVPKCTSRADAWKFSKMPPKPTLQKKGGK